MASSAVVSTEVVGLLPTLEVDAGTTLEGDMLYIGPGAHLFCAGIWCSIRTLVSERNILRCFCF